MDRNTDELYYFIPIAVSAIFSFIIFPAALIILDLVCCTRISDIKMAYKDFSKIKSSNNVLKINGTYFYTFMFLLSGVALILLFIFAGGVSDLVLKTDISFLFKL